MTHLCPTCRRPLRSEPAGDLIAVWCPNGRCWSDVAIKGVEAATVELAAGRLIEAVEAEGVEV